MKHQTSNIKHLTSDTKRFIAKFYFPEPNWGHVPSGFPKLSKKGLTKEEGHLLDGIKLAWTASEGREIIFKRTVKGAIVATVVVILFFASTTLLTRSDRSLTKNVSAKTVTSTVEEFVEATMSAVFTKR